MAHAKYESDFLSYDESYGDYQFAVYLQYSGGQGSILFSDFLSALRFRDVLLKGGVDLVYVEELRCKVFDDEYLDEEVQRYGI